jgi:hypothetical protein
MLKSHRYYLPPNSRTLTLSDFVIPGTNYIIDCEAYPDKEFVCRLLKEWGVGIVDPDSIITLKDLLDEAKADGRMITVIDALSPTLKEESDHGE